MDLNPLLTHGWAGVLTLAMGGLIVGSFLNVVIYRLPLMLDREWRRQAREQLEMNEAEEPAAAVRLDLFLPGSHCPACGYRIRAVENIPVVSWLGPARALLELRRGHLPTLSPGRSHHGLRSRHCRRRFRLDLAGRRRRGLRLASSSPWPASISTRSYCPTS